MGKEKEMNKKRTRTENIKKVQEEFRQDFSKNKTRPTPKPNPLPKDVRKAMDKVYKQDTEARQILKELYDREATNKPKKKEFKTGGMVNPSYGTDFDDR